MAVGIVVTSGKDLEDDLFAKYQTSFDSRYYRRLDNVATEAPQSERIAIVSSISGTIDSTSNSGSGNISSTTFTYRSVPGVPAGSYTIGSLVQMLSKMSHTHFTAKGTVSSNCNCQCNCNCDSDCICDSGCFVSGKLLTTRGEVDVSEVAAGDVLIDDAGGKHEVLAVATSTLGKRSTYALPLGGTTTSDHVLYIDDKPYAPSLDAYKAVTKTFFVAEGGLVGAYGAVGAEQLENAVLGTAPEDTPTYSPICECRFAGLLNGQPVLIAGAL